MPFQVPSTWKVFDQTNNQITLQRVGHSVQAPRLAIITRGIPAYNAATQRWSASTYRIRVIDGLVDGDSNPSGERTLFDGTFRTSVTSGGPDRVDEVVADLLAIIDQTDFVSAVLAQTFPSIASS